MFSGTMRTNNSTRSISEPSPTSWRTSDVSAVSASSSPTGWPSCRPGSTTLTIARPASTASRVVIR